MGISVLLCRSVRKNLNKLMAARQGFWHLWVGLVLYSVYGFNNTGQKEPTVCSNSQFDCSNGFCIPQTWTCDGELDCQDGSDEYSCSPEQISSCLQFEFRCGSGLCIPLAWQCDGENDCPDDALDEWDHLCRKERCKEDEFRCEVESSCIPQGWQCDGVDDCMDASDETKCNV